jgi:hypothetical protein
MNHSSYFITANYKISKPNRFQYVDIIVMDKKRLISMDCFELYELLKKENLDIDSYKNFLLSHGLDEINSYKKNKRHMNHNNNNNK